MLMLRAMKRVAIRNYSTNRDPDVAAKGAVVLFGGFVAATKMCFYITGSMVLYNLAKYIELENIESQKMIEK